MATTKNGTIKGVQNIRTLAGRVDQSGQPYQAYLRIGALEMEKARRNKERESAMARVNNIDIRVHEIEIEKAALLNKVAACRQEPFPGQNSDKKSVAGNFKIRY